MDFAEFFTQSARELVPLAWQKGLLFLFDFRGPLLWVDADERSMHDALQRPALAALELLSGGFVLVCAQTELQDSGAAELSISIAGTGVRADEEHVGAVLQSLGLHERARDPEAADESARVALGHCPITGATISFAANRSDGLLFAFDLCAPARLLDESRATPHADGARAWLISEAAGSHPSLERRLQRLGWATYTFSSAQRAVDQLARMTPAMARPALVIGAESPQVTLEHLRVLRSLLPLTTRIVLTTAIDSPTRVEGLGIELRRWPLSPMELQQFTLRACEAVDTISGHTMPAPLVFANRPSALVVDDNQVNLLVASGLLQMAGFEVETAASGEEAVARCRARPPMLVLMDVHMPGMDGLAATRELRRLQREGALPHFAIIAATANALGMGGQACFDAGMDGYVSKPLNLQLMQREIARVLPHLQRGVAGLQTAQSDRAQPGPEGPA